jgi:cytochrome c oxidase assembly protein subunit 11
MSPILRTGILAAGLAGGMTGLGYASVPLYRAFCQATGFAGTTQRADVGAAPVRALAGHTISIRFDANHAPELPWEFGPEKPRESVTIGERDMAFFEAKNLSARSITGRATYNVTPTQAGKYFTKVQCFCFTEQTLRAGEQVRMPVIFYVDPKIATDPDTKGIQEITLSYTFYPVDEAKTPS